MYYHGNSQRCSVDEDVLPQSIPMRQIEMKPIIDRSTDPQKEATNMSTRDEGKPPMPSLFKWSTGAGPRIRCVRDYPTGLRSQALEQVKLSPRLTNGASTTLVGPIPSPRPSPKIHLSPRITCMGIGFSGTSTLHNQPAP